MPALHSGSGKKPGEFAKLNYALPLTEKHQLACENRDAHLPLFLYSTKLHYHPHRH